MRKKSAGRKSCKSPLSSLPLSPPIFLLEREGGGKMPTRSREKEGCGRGGER